MPKVSNHKKTKAGQPYDCVSCTDKIVAGQRYYEWTFYKSNPSRQHESHGRPKPSQLTRSNMSGALAAIEGCEQDIAGAEDPSDLRDALETCKNELESVRDTYQEGYDNMGSLQESEAGQNSQAKIDALDETISNIDTAIGEIEDLDDDVSDEDKDTKMSEYRDSASEALNLEA